MKLRPYQQRLAKHVIDNKLAAIFVDMGYGKTVAMLAALAYLFESCQSIGALVVAPINVIETTWPDEMQAWPQFRHLTYSKIRGSLAGKQRLKQLKMVATKPNKTALGAIAKSADLYLVNYENLAPLCAWASMQKTLPFDVIIFDESSFLKAPASKRFKHLRTLLPRIERRYILTGTPSPERLLDLWSQLYCVNLGQSLGHYFSTFRDQYFTHNPWTYETKLIPGADKKIQAAIKPWVFALRDDEILSLPDLIHNEIAVVLPPKVLVAYRQFERQLYTRLLADPLEAANAAVLSGRCRQLTSGAVYGDAMQTLSRPFTEYHTAKLDALETILESTTGNVIVLYEFKHELARLLKRWPKAATMGAKHDAQTIKLWNDGAVKLLLSHPASLSHGLNLQHGGCTLVWLTLTWSQGTYAQACKRLHRHGQTHPVVSHRIIARQTIDGDVWCRIAGKHKRQADLLAALKERL